MRITELLEKIASEICDNYCKYPDVYTDEVEMTEEVCISCPLVNLL